jgi:calcium-dependent protein kinase
MKELLNNIFTFNMEKTLQIPVINYLVHNNLEGSSYVNYASILFSKIDINNDGSLNKNEFIQNMNMIFSEFDTEIDKEFLMEVFDKIDVDKSNKIGYREFVCAAVDRKELLKDNMLKEAFEFFDKDKNGSISLEEIKKAFSKTQGYNHNDFNEILKQIDLNNDAVIDFAEFKSMMKAILD